MIPAAKLIAYLVVTSSIVLAGCEASAGTTDINDAKKLSISTSSDPVQHDTKQPLQAADTGVTNFNEERMLNPARLRGSNPVLPILDVYGLRREPHLQDMHGPAGVPRSIDVSRTDQARVHEDLLNAASTSNPRKKRSRAVMEENEGEDNDVKILKNIKALFERKVSHPPKKRMGRRVEDNVQDIIEAYEGDFNNIMQDWWLDAIGPDKLREILVKNGLSTYVFTKYKLFHADQNNKMNQLIARWLEDNIQPEEIVDKLNAVIPNAKGRAVVTRYENEYKMLYKDLQRLKPHMDKWLIQRKTPEDFKRLVSKKRNSSRNVFSGTTVSTYRRIYSKQLFEKYPAKHWQEWVQKEDSPHDIRSIMGLGKLKSPKLFEHPNYQDFLLCLKWWCETHPTGDWQKWLPKEMPPEDVRFILGLAQLKGLELLHHPNFPEYIKFFELWHEARTRRKMKEWMQLNTPPGEVSAKLAIRSHDHVAYIPDKSDVYIKQYENEWKKKHPTLEAPAVST